MSFSYTPRKSVSDRTRVKPRLALRRERSARLSPTPWVGPSELSRPHGRATALASRLRGFHPNNTAMGEHDVQKV